MNILDNFPLSKSINEQITLTLKTNQTIYKSGVMAFPTETSHRPG